MANTVVKNFAIFQDFLHEGTLKQPFFMSIFHREIKRNQCLRHAQKLYCETLTEIGWCPLLNTVNTRNRTKRAKNDIVKYRTQVVKNKVIFRLFHFYSSAIVSVWREGEFVSGHMKLCFTN